MVLTRQQQQARQNAESLADTLNIPYYIVGEEFTVPIERLEGLLGQRERREDFLIEVIGNLCKKLGKAGQGSDEKLGRAEVNRRRNSFTRTGEQESRREDMLIDQLKTESGKVKDTNQSLLGQYNAEKRRYDQIKAAHEKEVRKNKEKSQQIANLQRKKSALERSAAEQVSKVQTPQASDQSKGRHFIDNGSQARPSKILVSGLPFDVSEAHIKDTFRDLLGPSNKVSLYYDHNGRSRGTAEVLFFKPGEAARAVTELEGMLFHMRFLEAEAVVKGHMLIIPDSEPMKACQHPGIASLQSQIKNMGKTATAQDNKIMELRGLRFSKDEEIAKLKHDFDTLLTKTAGFDKDQRTKIDQQQSTIKQLETNIKRIEAYRPTIDSTCRLIQMAYREFKIGKRTLEQEILKQQKEISLLLPEEETAAHLSNKLREQYASSCLLEWKVQEQETEMKEMKTMLEEQGSELETKDQQVKILYDKLTERMHKLKSGHVLEKGRRYSF